MLRQRKGTTIAFAAEGETQAVAAMAKPQNRVHVEEVGLQPVQLPLEVDDLVRDHRSLLAQISGDACVAHAPEITRT